MKILLYIEAAVHFERLKKLLHPVLEAEILHIDEDHSTKMRLLPHVKETILALVDCDANFEGALDFTKTINQLTATKPCPIIAMSSSSEVTVLKRMMEAGCSDFILKPFEDINVITRLQKALNNQMVVDPGGYLDAEPQATPQVSPQAAPKTAPLDLDPTLATQIELPKTVPLEWHPDFEVGVEAVDEDHKKIIEHYRDLYLSMREGKGHGDYEKHMSFLMDYVNDHFLREEKLQQENGYPDFEQHRNMHRAFTKRVERLMEDHRGKEVSHQALIQLNLFIKDWLLRHILVEDRKIGLYIAKKDVPK